MKRSNTLVRTAVLIFLVLVSLVISGIHVASACSYTCYIEELCFLHPYDSGCEQYFGYWVFDVQNQIMFCDARLCYNPCSHTCI